MSDFDTITMSNTIVLPGNSQKTPLIDSTYWNYAPHWAPATNIPAPGFSRGALGGRRITGTVLPTVQNVTLSFYLLTNPSGTTNAAWELDINVSGTSGTGSVTVTAGSTQPFSWLPPTPDFLIVVAAGATAPTALRSTLEMVTGRTSGS